MSDETMNVNKEKVSRILELLLEYGRKIEEKEDGKVTLK